jgi:opacity protein-like surface antigen
LDFDDLPVAPHVDLGLIYISNKLSDLEQTSSGFGLTFGAGADKHLTDQWIVDFAIRYIKGFEQSVNDRTLGTVKSLQDGMQLFVGIHYEFTDPNLK